MPDTTYDTSINLSEEEVIVHEQNRPGAVQRGAPEPKICEDQSVSVAMVCSDDWGPYGAPGLARELGLKPVPRPEDGSNEYKAVQAIEADIRKAMRRISKAGNDEARFQIVRGCAKKLRTILDGRHSNLPLIEGHLRDPLFLLALSAREVASCLTNGKYAVSVGRAKDNIARVNWEKPLLIPSEDVRENAHDAFLELVQLIVEPSSDA